MVAEPQRLGPWLLERRLGAGAFGTVFSGRHAERPELVRAIKWIPANELDALVRFEREAEVLARIRAPGIVQIHELGRAPGGVYLVLDLVAGRPLRALLDEAPSGVPLERAVALTTAIARALGAAHAAGVSHRDLKPENVLVDEGGLPRIIDFGLALAVGDERLTQTGVVLGTLGYMSPEQLDGRRELQGPASDVYSLGIIFYELLTGRRPFPGSELALLRAMAGGKFPRASEGRALPAWVDEVIARALARSPERRLPDGAAFARELEARARWEGSAAAARARRRRVVLGAVALVALALGLAALLLVRERRRADASALAALQGEVERLPLDATEAGTLAGLQARRARLGPSEALDHRLALLASSLALRHAEGERRLELAWRFLEEPTGDLKIERLPGGDALIDEAFAPILAAAESDPTKWTPRLEALARTGPIAAIARSRIVRTQFQRALATPGAAARARLLESARSTDRPTLEREAERWAARTDLPRERLDDAIEAGRAVAKVLPRADVRNRLARLLLQRCEARRALDPGLVLADRRDAAEADPDVLAPPWYPGFVQRFASERAFQGSGPDRPFGAALQALALTELVAEDAVWGLDLATAAGLSLEARGATGFATPAERDVTRIFVGRFVNSHPDGQQIRELETFEETAVRPRLARAVRVLRRHAHVADPLLLHSPPSSDFGPELLGAAFGWDPEAPNVPVAVALGWTQRAFEGELVWAQRTQEALAWAPGDLDLWRSRRIALIRAANALEERARVVVNLGRVELAAAGNDLDRQRVWEHARPAMEDLKLAVAICPEGAFFSLILGVRRLAVLSKPPLGLDRPVELLAAERELEADERWRDALDDPTRVHPTVLAAIVQVSFWSALAHLEVVPPHPDEARALLVRANRFRAIDLDANNIPNYRELDEDIRARLAELEKH